MKGALRIVFALYAIICLWRLDVVQPVAAQIEVSEDEYVVYSDVLRQIYSSEKISLIVILDKTQPSKYISPNILDNRLLAQRLAPLTKETLDDFLGRNREKSVLSRKFRIDKLYDLVTREEVDQTIRSGGPDAFRARFTGSFGYIEFSRVGFNREMNQAVVFTSTWCGRLCGSGDLWVLTKENGVWKIGKPLQLWIS